MTGSKRRIDAIGKIDVSMLVALHIVLSERSVGKAAADVGLSQPAMSNALGRMRAAFDDPLLVRTHGKMELTVRGQEILQQLELILPQIERLTEPSEFEPERTQAIFNIAANDLSVQLLGPELVRIVSLEAPHAELSIATLQSRELDQEKLDVDYNLRIGWFPAPPPSWFIRKLFEDEMVVIADPKRIELGDTITVSQFTSLPHVGIRMHPNSAISNIDKMLIEKGSPRHVSIWLSNFNAISHVITDSNLLALVPRTIAERYQQRGNVRIVNPPVTLDTLRVSMAWPPTVHYDPANRWLRNAVVRASQGCGTASPSSGIQDPHALGTS